MFKATQTKLITLVILKPNCWAFDAEPGLIDCPLNMLVSIPGSLRNSLSQRETVSTDTGL